MPFLRLSGGNPGHGPLFEKCRDVVAKIFREELFQHRTMACALAVYEFRAWGMLGLVLGQVSMFERWRW